MSASTTSARRWPPAVKLVMGARFARSVGQGALVVGFTLYLSALGWNAAAIGAVLSAALLFGVVLTLAIGPASDRLGRRKFLLGYECVAGASAVMALASGRTDVLIVATILGSFGRGANGAAGPFGPLEQAWLAQDLPPDETPRVFNLNSMLGFTGMAVGAMLAGLPAAWSRALPGPLAYRPLFVLPLLGSAIGFLLIWKAPEAGRAPRPAAPARRAATGAPAAPKSEIRRMENRLLRRLAFANALNGLGIGLIAPLMAYWFMRRFGHGPASIGPALAAGFLLAALGTQLSQLIVARMGVVRTVVVMRSVGIVLMLLTPLVPVFFVAAAVWAVRAAFNQGTMGVRQALSMGLTRQHRRGLAATVNNVSIQVPRAIGPAIAGLMLHRGWLTAPFVLAALFQFGYLVLYERFFGDLASVEAQAPAAVATVRVEA
ncbi:MAG: MFS transporter [Gemmatimonadota bacterium]|nr:MFS transporter [Gemmatimonadota bacterium]